MSMPTTRVIAPIAGCALTLCAACGGGDASIFEETGTPAVFFDSPASPTESPRPTPTPGEPAQTEAPADDDGGEQVSLAWLDSSADVPPLPVPFAAPVPDLGLLAAIDGALPDFDGEYSVVVHNLVDGRYAARNEAKVYYGASLYKASLLYEAYRQREAGTLDFAMEVEMTEEYAEYDLGSLEYLELEVGDLITIEDAVRAMTIISDTPTAVLIQDIIGAQADQTLLNLGLRETQFLNRELPTSARDMARLVEVIASGGGVSDAARLQMLALLRQEWFVEGVVAGSQGSAVAHKSGSLNDATHDVAVVWGPAGPYIISVMTDASYDFEPVRDVAKAVYDYFAANP